MKTALLLLTLVATLSQAMTENVENALKLYKKNRWGEFRWETFLRYLQDDPNDDDSACLKAFEAGLEVYDENQ